MLQEADDIARTGGRDAQGRRIRKTIGSESTYYLYGLVGLMSEFTTVDTGATAAASDDRLQYHIAEQTGTPVMLVDPDGIVRENNRVFPFGEPWNLTVSSPNDQDFTSYQRDSESGLDYAMARHYASRSGRFMTPDPGHVGANVGDPQSWNAYGYTANDPINRIDPSGLDYILCDMRNNCIDGYPDLDFLQNFYFGRDVNVIGDRYGSGLIYSRDEGYIGTYEYYDPRTDSEKRFDAVVRGTQMAAPTVNLLGDALKIIAAVANPAATMSVLCLTGAPDCTKTGVAMAALPSGFGKLGNAGRILPGNARIFQSVQDAFSHLQRFHGT